MTIERGSLLWEPAADPLTTREGRFIEWLGRERGVRLAGHRELWQWSVEDLEGFWAAIWDHFGVRAQAPAEAVLADRRMPGARWFPGSRLNYAEHALAGDPQQPAVIGVSQTRERVELSFAELADRVGRARQVLQQAGVRCGDRVAAWTPNIPETVVAFLAAASLGAVWASCAPEFGPRSVIDRFAQIEPTVLLVIGGYRYGDKDISRIEEVAEVRAALPGVRAVIDLGYGEWRVPDTTDWHQALAAASDARLEFASVPFDHPLFVLFSSGTTGLPKAIVHGHGGILLEHLKNHALSWDMGPGDRMLWFSTTAWMMWNALVSGLLVRATIILIDGNPMWPSLDWQWQLAEELQATVMGANPGWVMACRKAGISLRQRDLAVRVVGSAGAPLPPEGYQWILDQFQGDVLLNVGSGGTDVCSGIVQNDPLLPVYAGEISGRCLGVAAYAFDEAGEPVVGELGELVITEPMPSMPLGLWGDTHGERLRTTYFDHYPGIWRHGDWIIFNDNGSCHVSGRSDATLNRGGVRLGTAEFYRVVEELEPVADSLIVHLEDPAGGNGELILLVRLAPGAADDDALRRQLRTALRERLSPRHAPDTIEVVPAIPRNRTGKKLELPVKRILQGADPDRVASRDALADATSLDPVVRLARRRSAG